MLKKPEKRWKNIMDARRDLMEYTLPKHLTNLGWWPCLHCKAGRIYDPNDPPDIIEGYKLVRRINCPICKGTAKGSKKLFMEMYNKELDDWKEKSANYKAAKKRLSELKKTLTDDDMQLIATHMSNHEAYV